MFTPTISSNVNHLKATIQRVKALQTMNEHRYFIVLDCDSELDFFSADAVI